ncbi:GNAT family N-acetyltransferase [soil metagenome]
MSPRPATLAEAPALAAVHASSFDRPWSAAEIAALLESPGVEALALESDGHLAAFILVRTVAGEAEILTLAVRPQARRSGLARALTEAAIRLCASSGAETLFLEVAADNAPALGLYVACGFEIAGRRPRYYDRGPAAPAQDALLMRRALPTAPASPYSMG